jgi:queuosine precursor transporter|tara:strand:- start:1801 stop:2271 length:471 start_codon:yes stop_codon:yes gene_type:complete
MDKYKYTGFYILSVVLVNIGFVYIPMISLFGEMFPPMTLVVGAIFILRDYAQREIGHKILGAMLIGAVLSYFMADPYIAVASLVAFIISEVVDWSVYTFTKKPLAQRILISSAISTPIDSLIFLQMIGSFTTTGFLVMTIAKMLAALLVWWKVKEY